MTQHEYTEYKTTVAAFMVREGIQNLTTDSDPEPWFSWAPCHCCNTHLGGNRENATGYNPTTKEVQEYVICSDCVYYAEYGKLDDMTMMEMRQA
jgi:hypothetical protein